MSGYVIKVTLEGCKPPVWRNVRIPKNITFKTLHEIIQVIYGWEDMHLHEFMTDDKTTSVISDYEDEVYTDYAYDEEDTRVNELLEQHKWIRYTYDFGDEWRHKITLQKVDEAYPYDYAEVIRYKGDNFIEDAIWGEDDEDIDDVGFFEQRSAFELEVVNERLRDMDYEFSDSKPQDIDGLTDEMMDDVIKMGQLWEEAMAELSEEEQQKVLQGMEAFVGEMERMEQLEQKMSSIKSTAYQPTDHSKSVNAEIAFEFRENLEQAIKKGSPFRWELATEFGDMRSRMKLTKEIDLRNYCRYCCFEITDDMQKSDFLEIYVEGMQQNPLFILEYLHREEIECLINLRKGKHVAANDDFMEACFRAAILGLMEIENCKKKDSCDAKLKWTKEGAYILDYLEQNAWRKQVERIEKYSHRIAMLIHVYGVMDFDFIYNKITETWKSDISMEELKRILYCQFNFNMEARTFYSDLDGKNYVVDRTLDMEDAGIMQMQYASDVDYYPYTRKEIECTDSGFNALHMCWSQMDFILMQHSDLNTIDRQTLVEFSYEEARKGRTPGEILDVIIKRTHIKSYMLQFYLWDTLMTCCINTGLPMLKGYTRAQFAKKKKLPVMFFGLIDSELCVRKVNKTTPIYKMEPAYQMDIYNALEIQNVDEAVEALQYIENSVCPGNYEIRFAQVAMYFDRGETEKLKPILEKLKKELKNKDQYLDLLCQEIYGNAGRYEVDYGESAFEWMDRLMAGEVKSNVETYRRETAKIGRNDPCPCGSGKKYKKCCGA